MTKGFKGLTGKWTRFLKRRTFSVIILIVVGAGVLAASASSRLDSYQAMYERGDYNVLRQELYQVLAVQEWQAGRNLLTQLYLTEGNPAAALEQIIILNAAGWDTAELEATLLSNLTSATAETCLQQLGTRHGIWGLELHLRIAMAVDNFALVLDSLDALLAVDKGNHLAQAVRNRYTDLLDAWRISLVLDSSTDQKQVVDRVFNLAVTDAKEQRIGQLLQYDPENPTLKLLETEYLPTDQALAVLGEINPADLYPGYWELYIHKLHQLEQNRS